MSKSENKEAAPAAETEKKEAVVLRFCKGTMPSPLVWFIRFHEEGENRSSIAAKYFTTPGKISDIQTNSNQKYIVEDMQWSKEELDAAADQIKVNFVRGQALEAEKPGSVTKRQLATTTAEDAEYSLNVIESIRGMKLKGVTIADARAEYSEANPRPTKAKAEDADAKEDTAVAEDADQAGDDPLEDDDLLG